MELAGKTPYGARPNRGVGAARSVQLPGRSHEPVSDGWSRGMIIASSSEEEQKPAYRPADSVFEIYTNLIGIALNHVKYVRYNSFVPKVTVLPEGRTVEFESGQMPFSEHGKPESILDVCLNHGINLEHACGGSCACTTCHVIVKEGDANLSEMDDEEADRLDMAPGLTLHSRLGCQAVVKGDVVIEIPSWTKNFVSEGGGLKL